jgi:hypothetical protein
MYTSIDEGRQFVYFVLFVLITSTELGCPLETLSERAASDLILHFFGKLLMSRGAWAWFQGVWTCSLEILEY